MIRLLAPLAFVSLGFAAEQDLTQATGAFVQAPLASVQQPQYFFPQQLQQASQQQQYFQFQPQVQPQQQQQFYYPQQTQPQQQSFYYPFQQYQQVQYAPVQPVQPAFEMSPKLSIPTGLLRKHVNASSDEPSVFAMSYNPETGIKVATINGKKVFAYKQRFPGAPKEDVEIVENGDVKTSGNPVVVASTTENEKGEKTKNVWFDDKEDPMVKIEKEPVIGAAVSTTTVDPNLPVVSQDGVETTTLAATTEATTTATVAAEGVTVTPIPEADVTTAAAVPAAVTVAAEAAAAVVLPTTAAAPAVVPTTTAVPVPEGKAFFAAQNPMYAANVAAFSQQYPQYFPTRFAAKPFAAPFAVGQQPQPHYAAFPSTVAPAAVPTFQQVPAVPLAAGSGLTQVHPVYAQSAISTTPMPQAVPQYIARPVAVGVPRPIYVAQPIAVPVAQPQYLQSTPMSVVPQQQQYLSTVQPAPQQYVQPVQQPQFVQQPQQQQYLQPTTTPQPVPQYIQSTAQPQYIQQQPQVAPVVQQQQQQYYPQQPQAWSFHSVLNAPIPAPIAQQPQPQYIQQQPVQQQQYQQPQHPGARYPAPAPQHQYVPPPPTPAYHNVQRPAPPQDFTEEEQRPAEPVYKQHQGATSTAPPGMIPDSNYHVPSQYQQANGYESTTPEPEGPPSPPTRYNPAPSTSRYVERPAENSQTDSTPGYGAPEPTTYAPRPAPTRRPYYPKRPTSSYSRPAYRQPYRRVQQQRPRYNPNRKVTYYRAGTNQPYRNSNSYVAPRTDYTTTTTQSSIPDYVPSPSYRQHSEYRPQSQYSQHPAQPQYASQNAYSHPAPYMTTTTESPAPGEHYYARVPHNDQSKVAYSEAPFDNMEFLSTPFPVGQKKDVKVTFINRHRLA